MTMTASSHAPAEAPGSPAAPRRLDLDVAAVIFDMDGLLLDSEPLWDRVTDGFCVARGARYTETDSAVCRGRGVDHTARYLSETKGFPLDVDAHVREIEDAFLAAVETATYCVGAPELLRSLHGHLPIAVGSSSPRPIVERALGPRGALALFDAVVTGSDVVHRKPAPDIFLEAARRLGVSPSKCVVLEDSVAGCLAARAAGMIGIGVSPTPYPALEEAAVHLAKDLHAVAEMLGFPR
jgi:beta-phosphoglucomutase-like phosphatase (HAD superfamily)